MIKKEISALWEEISKKKREFKLSVQDAVNRIRQASGSSSEIDKAAHEGKSAEKEIHVAALQAESDINSAQYEYVEADLKASPAKSAMDERHYFSKTDMDAIRKEIERRASGGSNPEETSDTQQPIQVGGQ